MRTSDAIVAQLGVIEDLAPVVPDRQPLLPLDTNVVYSDIVKLFGIWNDEAVYVRQ